MINNNNNNKEDKVKQLLINKKKTKSLNLKHRKVHTNKIVMLAEE